MILTNNFGVPDIIVRAIKKQQSEYKSAGFITGSSTAKSPRQFWGEKRHFDEAKKDVLYSVASMMGTALHILLENVVGDNELSEEYFEYEIIPGRILSGSCDNYNGKTKIVTDYKSTSVYSYLSVDHQLDWEKQLNTYAYLYRKMGFEVRGIAIQLYLRDWMQSKQFQKDYPMTPVPRVELRLWPMEEIEAYLIERAELFIKYENTPDDDLPLCTIGERWASPDVWRVKKEGGKIAMRGSVTEDQTAAEEYADVQREKGNKVYVEHVPGKSAKCERYCLFAEFCNQFKNEKEGMDSVEKKEVAEEVIAKDIW